MLLGHGKGYKEREWGCGHKKKGDPCCQSCKDQTRLPVEARYSVDGERTFRAREVVQVKLRDGIYASTDSGPYASTNKRNESIRSGFGDAAKCYLHEECGISHLTSANLHPRS